MFSPSADAVLAEHGVDRASLQLVVEGIVEVLREAGVKPTAAPALYPQETGAGDNYVLVRVPIACRSEFASELTWALAARLATRGVDQQRMLVAFSSALAASAPR